MDTTLQWSLNLLIAQGMMGAFDTLYHHELTQALPKRPAARKELGIHAVRAVLYGIVFAAIAHLEFHGVWALAMAALVIVEVILTLWDFVVEDQSRKLPASERILHTLLAINGGALFGLYAWQLGQWLALPTTLVSADFGGRGWVLTLFALGVAVSGVRDGITAARLGRLPLRPNSFAEIPHQRLLVTGGTGFIGAVLVNQLLDAGHSVTVLTRDPLRAAYLFAGRAACVRALDRLSDCERFDTVINLAGAPVVGPRWSDRRKAALLASRVETTEALLDWLSRAHHRPTVWVQASAIGYYGVRSADEKLSEAASRGSGFMSDLCANWESLAANAQRYGVRQVNLRLGLVFGPGGALPPLLLPHYFCCGGKLGDGRQIMSWIHRDDVLSLIAKALCDDTMQGPYNAVAPDALPQAEFARRVGRLLHRPVWFHVPVSLIRWLAGEMAQLFVDGQWVVPERLQAAGFVYAYPALDDALRDLV